MSTLATKQPSYKPTLRNRYHNCCIVGNNIWYTTLGSRDKAKHRATATYFPCDLWNVKMSWEYAVEPCFTDTSLLQTVLFVPAQVKPSHFLQN